MATPPSCAPGDIHILSSHKRPRIHTPSSQSLETDLAPLTPEHGSTGACMKGEMLQIG